MVALHWVSQLDAAWLVAADGGGALGDSSLEHGKPRACAGSRTEGLNRLRSLRQAKAGRVMSRANPPSTPASSRRDSSFM